MKKPDDRVGQVQVIPIRHIVNWEVLILKRNQEKGGFWQSVTGGIHPHEALQDAAYRELYEETGITKDKCERLIDDGYEFEFIDILYGTMQERVFAAVIKNDAIVTRSDEHTEHRWVSPEEALELIRYETGRTALSHYMEVVSPKEELRV